MSKIDTRISQPLDYMAPVLRLPTKRELADMLSDPLHGGREWTYQGLGMVRTHLGMNREHRINVWHHRFRIPGVSTVHNHPWDLISIVQAGVLVNSRYSKRMADTMPRCRDIGISGSVAECEPATLRYYPMNAGIVRCGIHGGLDRTTVCETTLYPFPTERYEAGHTYRQRAYEVHETGFDDGTVTLNLRSNRNPNSDAWVYWPLGTKWVDAEPRPATREEIYFGCEVALRKMRSVAAASA
jgi:hypothetical protein